MPRTKPGYITLTTDMRNWMQKGLETTGLRQTDLVRDCGLPKSGLSNIMNGGGKLIHADKWANVKALFASKGYGSEKLDGPVDERALMVTKVLGLKRKMACSWPDLAATLGVTENTLKKFTRGTQSRSTSVASIKAGLVKLEGLPSKLVAQGVLPAPAPKASVIEVMPSHAIPSALEIDMKILELTGLQIQTLTRLRGYHDKPTHLNGSRT